jgi:hypothetical protein
MIEAALLGAAFGHVNEIGTTLDVFFCRGNMVAHREKFIFV